MSVSKTYGTAILMATATVKQQQDNAILNAKTPVMDAQGKTSALPDRRIRSEVGLPDRQMGNSEIITPGRRPHRLSGPTARSLKCERTFFC